jgi:hypothetical protein
MLQSRQLPVSMPRHRLSPTDDGQQYTEKDGMGSKILDSRITIVEGLSGCHTRARRMAGIWSRRQ